VHVFDPGYVFEPFASLCRGYPGEDVYPLEDFRLEWGPIFHRGRLDGTARVLVIGQDPASHEAVARRILVGEAGQRVQGFLAKLGLTSSYVMINAFLYSVYGQFGGERHKDDPAIAAYRNRWIDALVVGKRVEAVLTLGRLANEAYEQWRTTPTGQMHDIPSAGVIHPTYPESVSAARIKKKADAMKELLANWNEALAVLRPAIHVPETDPDPTPYGEELTAADLAEIPEMDLPAGIPAWMRAKESWARRDGDDEDEKRASIRVRMAVAHRIWR
jgi:uracil-DNA glycosylase